MSKKKTKKKTPAQAPKKSRSTMLWVLGAAVAVLVVLIAVVVVSRPDPSQVSEVDSLSTGSTLPDTRAPSGDTPVDPQAAKRIPPGPDMHSLLVDPRNPEHVFYGNHDGLYESLDGGAQWKSVPTLAKQDAMALDMDGNALWVAGHDILFKGAMKGDFLTPRTDLPGTDIHGFAAAASEPGTMYAFVVGHGLQKTTDGGRRWQPVAEATRNMGVHGLAVDRSDSDVIYAIEMMSGLLRSTDGGKTWGPTTLPVPSMNVATGNGGVVLAASEQGVYRSADGGATWEKTDSGPAVLVAISSGEEATAYMVDPQGGLHRSDDGGANWR